MRASVLKEYRTFGPPGTGKTTFLARQIEKAAGSKGSQNILVCSFTKAAVRELNRRELPIPEANLGTLHALAYRALGMPTICETAKGFKDFQEFCPHYTLTDATLESLDDGKATTDNDILSTYSLLRSTMTKRPLWPDKVLAFATMWERFKAETAAVDFADLIELALRDVPVHPAEPIVGFFDECQDFTPMELALVRQWGAGMEQIVLCADDDQMIYAFKGSQVESLLSPLPEENIRILSQSYRVPRRVHALASDYIRRIPPQWRQPKAYLPRDAEGEVLQAPETANYASPAELLPMAREYVDRGKTVLFLASCGYMLNPLIECLRDEGVPFSNPWRRRRGDWNPLHRARRKLTQDETGESAAAMVMAYFAARGRGSVLWTGRELKTWTPLTKGVLKRGGKLVIDRLPDDQLIPIISLLDVMSLDAVMAAQDLSETWLAANMQKKYQRAAEYAIRVCQNNPPEVLVAEPSIYVGTIHSLKGGEADVVILFPDISPRAASEDDVIFRGCSASSEPFQHQIIRQFYVGMTRARETLIVCPPHSPKFYATFMGGWG